MNTDEKKYLLDLIKNAMTVDINEHEGQQTIDLNALNLCSVDYSDNTGNKDTVFSGRNMGENLVPQSDNKEILIDSDKKNTGSFIDTGNYANLDMPTINEIINNINVESLLNATPENISDVIAKNDSGEKVIIEFADKCINDKEVEYELYVKPGETITEDTIIGEVEQYGRMIPIKSIFSTGTVMGTPDNSDFLHLYPSVCNRHIIIDNIQFGTNMGVDTTYMEQVIDKFQHESYLYNLICTNLCYSSLPAILMRRKNGKKNGISIFNDFRKKQDDISKKFIDDMKKEAKAENIKKTSANYKKVNKLGDKLLDMRAKRIENTLELYNSIDTLPQCEYDRNYKDCHMLAAGIEKYAKYKNRMDDINYKIDDENYDNYYMSILANITLTSDNDTYSYEFFNLISNIIDRRNIYEKYDIKHNIAEFEDIFYDTLDSKKKTKHKNIMKVLEKAILDKDVSYNNIYEWFKNNIDKSEKKEAEMRQLASVYLYIRKHQIQADSVNEAIRKRNIMVSEWKYFEQTNYDIDAIRHQFIEKYYANIDPEHKYEFDVNDIRINSRAMSYNDIFNWFNDHASKEDVNYLDVREVTNYYIFIMQYKKYNGDIQLIADNWYDKKFDILELVKDEYYEITTFWKKVLAEYEQCKIPTLLEDFKEMAFSFSKYAVWPQEQQFYLNGITYHHYLFENLYPEEEIEPEDEDIGDYDDVKQPEIPEDWPAPENPTLDGDLDENENDVHLHEITIKDFKYWQKYFALATAICLVPLYWNCGLDILPWVQLVPFPCIFVAIYSTYIQLFDIVIVFGIAIRGMYVSPIVLFVNASDNYASVTTPLIGVIKNIQNTFANKLQQLEYIPIQSIANTFITKFEKENEVMLQENKKYEIYLSLLKTVKTENQEYIKDVFRNLKERKK